MGVKRSGLLQVGERKVGYYFIESDTGVYATSTSQVLATSCTSTKFTFRQL